MNSGIEPGSIVWMDLTVEEAPRLADFYSAVTGWEPEGVPVADYNDFNMTLPSGAPAAGICHAKGLNAGLPPQWLIYIVVADLDRSMQECWAAGGRVIIGPKDMGPGERFCVIRDPAGAVAALLERGSG